MNKLINVELFSTVACIQMSSDIEASCISFSPNFMKIAFEEAQKALDEGEVPVSQVWAYFRINT